MEISIGTSVIIVISSIGVIIAVVELIGKRFLSLSKENKEFQDKILSSNEKFREDMLTANERFRKEILTDNSKIKDYIFKYVSEHKTC